MAVSELGACTPRMRPSATEIVTPARKEKASTLICWRVRSSVMSTVNTSAAADVGLEPLEGEVGPLGPEERQRQPDDEQRQHEQEPARHRRVRLAGAAPQRPEPGDGDQDARGVGCRVEPGQGGEEGGGHPQGDAEREVEQDERQVAERDQHADPGRQVVRHQHAHAEARHEGERREERRVERRQSRAGGRGGRGLDSGCECRHVASRRSLGTHVSAGGRPWAAVPPRGGSRASVPRPRSCPPRSRDGCAGKQANRRGASSGREREAEIEAAAAPVP